MSSSPVLEAATVPVFVCDCEEWMHSACAGEPFYKEHEGKRYCVLHFPGKEKSEAFAEALKRKLDAEDFDFCGVWFPDRLTFENFTFSAEADFDSATFSAEVDFSAATFSAKVDFSDTTFRDHVKFAGDKDGRGFDDGLSFILRSARIEKPDHFSFHALTLRVHWFVDVDARKFNFTNVKWHGELNPRSIKQEIKSLKDEGVSSPHSLLSITYRHLAVNAEENHHYDYASMFRYLSMDTRRQGSWRGFAFWKLRWWYWLVSGYGERIFRAFLVLVGVWFVFALLYTKVSFAEPLTTRADESGAAVAKRVEYERLRELPRALTYSLSVMSLQKPEPRPETTEAQTLVAVETVLGPLQAALLALAIRRRFMR